MPLRAEVAFDGQVCIIVTQASFANSVPFFVAGFQHFSEKACGKELRYMRKAAQAARFGALHTIGCGC